MDTEVQLLLGIAAVAALGASILHWKHATVAALVLLILEGALRKWVLPEAQASLYLAKDFLLLGAYIGFAMRKVPRVPVPHTGLLMAAMAVFAVYGAAQVFNPSLPTIALGLVGWRAYFFYIPLVFIVPYLFDTPERLQRGLRWYAYLAIPIALLGLLQFYSPADSAINLNVQHAEGGGAALAFGSVDRVRVAGSFSFVSGYSAYLLAVTMLMLALIAGNRWRLRGNASLYAGLALAVAAMFATGSRGPVYSLVIAAVSFAVFGVLIGELSLSAAFKAALAGAALAIVMAYFLPEPADAFRSRAEGSDDTWSRLAAPITEPISILEQSGALGYGIGAAHQSAGFITGSAYSWWTDGMVAEAETSKVMLETGLLGVVLVMFFRIGIALVALRAALRLRERRARLMALGIALFLALQILGAVIFNPTMNVLYWLAVGVLFALHRFESGAAPAQVASQRLGGFAIARGSRRFPVS